jgi:sugar phosphate isomerase/epimerase
MKFYKLLAIFAVLLMWTTCMSAATKPKKQMAVQLYSIGSVIGGDKYAANHADAFKKLALWGYTDVEAADYNNETGKFYGRTPAEFKHDVESAGLKVLSSHTSKQLSAEELASGDFTESLNWWKKTIADHKAAGMKYIVNPWSGVPKTIKDLQTYCDYYNAVGKLCSENGIKFGYHNHNHEFQKVEGQVMYDYLIEHTNPSYVFFQMDVYWAVMGQAAPVDYFKKYPGRFKMLHIKDRAEVGQSGMVGFDAIFRNAKTAGLEHYVVEVEQTYTNDVMGCVKASSQYLHAAPFVKAVYPLTK